MTQYSTSYVILGDMADAKPGDKKLGSSDNDHLIMIAFLILLFILWIISGGPGRDPSSQTNQFINPLGGINGYNGGTYHDSLFGQPGSVTNTLLFLK